MHINAIAHTPSSVTLGDVVAFDNLAMVPLLAAGAPGAPKAPPSTPQHPTAPFSIPLDYLVLDEPLVVEGTIVHLSAFNQAVGG